jgi:hypothetical protein
MIPGGIYWEQMRRDEKSGGIAIKITKTGDGLYTGAPQQVWAYNLDGASVWYDLSTVFGDPFAGSRLEVAGDNGGLIVWANGTHPGGSQVASAPSEGNIFLTIDPAAWALKDSLKMQGTRTPENGFMELSKCHCPNGTGAVDASQ